MPRGPESWGGEFKHTHTHRGGVGLTLPSDFDGPATAKYPPAVKFKQRQSFRCQEERNPVLRLSIGPQVVVNISSLFIFLREPGVDRGARWRSD